MRREYRVEGLPEALSHYTDAVRFGDLIFISGVAPLNRANELVGVGDVVAQTRQIFSNLQLILDAVGAKFSDVIKVTVYLVDVKDREIINPIRKEYFGATLPASTLIGVSELAVPGMLVEIEAVVGFPGSN